MGLLVKLQNGETALKSLKFGKDRLGGGDSGQPYIQNPIIDEPGKLSQADNDFLLRGGLRAPINAIEDVARLTKYMFNLKNPSGLLFIAKQNLLSRVAVATEASISAGYANNPSKDLAWTKAPINQGIYTPLSTLLQAGVGWTGTHLNMLGINPFTPMTGIVNGGFLPGLGLIRYEDVVRGETRLTKKIQVEKWVPDPTVPTSVPKFDYSNSAFKKPKMIKVVEDQRVPVGQYENRLIYLWEKDMTNTNNAGGNLLEYSGGPGSILGVGKTRIKFGDLQRTGLNNPLISINSDYFYKGGTKLHVDDFIPNYTGLLGASVAADLINTQIGIGDDGKFDLFRKLGPHTPNYTLRPGSNYIGNDLTGSGAYQSNRSEISQNKYPTEDLYPQYVSPIETKLEEIGRELTSQPKFDPTTFTFEPTRAGSTIFIPKFSSTPSLAIDPNADVPGETLFDEQIAKDLDSSLNEGYLANLNKNGGVSSDGVISFHNPYRVGGRGISNDFRQVNRTKRGFNDPETTYDYIAPSGSQFIDYSNTKTLDNIYYKSNSSKRTSNPLNSDNDIIAFRIAIVNPLDLSSKNLYFKAYIDTFSDSYDAEWKPQTYMGRAEKQYKYNAFNRSISLGFTIVADNPTNRNKMYEQLNFLASSLAPSYTSQGYMAGNLHRLTMGNYIHEQWGIIEGFSYEITEDAPYEITRGEQLPLYIKVNGIKFTPIHNFRPEYKPSGPYQFINQSSDTNSPL